MGCSCRRLAVGIHGWRWKWLEVEWVLGGQTANTGNSSWRAGRCRSGPAHDWTGLVRLIALLGGLGRSPGRLGRAPRLCFARLGLLVWGWLGLLRSRVAARVVRFERLGASYSAVWRGSGQVQASHRSDESKGASSEWGLAGSGPNDARYGVGEEVSGEREKMERKRERERDREGERKRKIVFFRFSKSYNILFTKFRNEILF